MPGAPCCLAPSAAVALETVVTGGGRARLMRLSRRYKGRRVLGFHKLRNCQEIDLSACRLRREAASIGRQATWSHGEGSCYCGSLQMSEPPSRAESSQRGPWAQGVHLSSPSRSVADLGPGVSGRLLLGSGPGGLSQSPWGRRLQTAGQPCPSALYPAVASSTFTVVARFEPSAFPKGGQLHGSEPCPSLILSGGSLSDLL